MPSTKLIIGQTSKILLEVRRILLAEKLEAKEIVSYKEGPVGEFTVELPGTVETVTITGTIDFSNGEEL